MSMRRNACVLAAAAVLMLGAVPAVMGQAAATTQPTSAGVTGTYSWTFQGPQGDMEFKFVLKQDGDKLTGTVSGFGGDNEIEGGTISKTGDIVFKVSRDFGGNPMVTTYRGKIADGVFKGKSEMVMARDFEAKRVQP